MSETDGEIPSCVTCGTFMRIDDGCEPTPDCHHCARKGRDRLAADLARVTAERDEARETNARLNRRCQEADAAIREKIKAYPTGANLGRALANYGAWLYREERDAMVERVTVLEAALRWIDLRCDHYAPKSPAPYRAPLELIGNRARAALSTPPGDATVKR